jgi:hypothetical protein
MSKKELSPFSDLMVKDMATCAYNTRLCEGRAVERHEGATAGCNQLSENVSRVRVGKRQHLVQRHKNRAATFGEAHIWASTVRVRLPSFDATPFLNTFLLGCPSSRQSGLTLANT